MCAVADGETITMAVSSRHALVVVLLLGFCWPFIEVAEIAQAGPGW
jgi:hypothetical protein